MPFQGVEVVGPVTAVAVDPAVDPAVDLDEAVGAQRVDAALSVGTDLDQAHLAQHPEVPRHGGLGELGPGGHQLAGGAFPRGQAVEQGVAC